MRYLWIISTMIGVGSLTGHAYATEPIAAVYRGPAGCDDCTEAVANALMRSSYHFKVRIVGPKEAYPLNAESLKGVALFVQPGGGQDIPGAANSIGRQGAEDVRAFVAGGGVYLGICMGAYLASGLGYGLIDGDTDSEVGRIGFAAKTIEDTVVPINWRGDKTWLYYQDGPYLPSSSYGKPADIMATYSTGDIAAALYHYGAGKVALIGPHPEADVSWFAAHGLDSRATIDFHIFDTFVSEAMASPSPH